MYAFYGWETADMTDARGLTPRDYYDLLSDIWCADTCAPRMRDEWTPENRTLGQCSITAFLMQDLYGGEVRGILRSGGNYHCFNVVDGRTFDLTSEQFGDEVLDYSSCPEQFREIHFAKEEKKLRYEFLRDRLMEKLEKLEKLERPEKPEKLNRPEEPSEKQAERQPQNDRIQAEVTLKKGEGRLLKAGGLRIFDNEIAGVRGTYSNGSLVRVSDFDGYPMGTGFINDNSKIRVRMLTRDPKAVIDEAFFEERLRAAWEYRKRVVDTSSCRLVFGEADFLPGLTIDKYEDILVVESLALGIDRYKENLLRILLRILAEDGIRIRGIYERSDAKERLKEGMEQKSGFIGEPFDTDVEITENGVKYTVDVANGQKTGFFLDQKYNRAAVQRLCRGADVLDCFTHTGSFALNAAYAGAAHVTGVDASERAVEMARRNAAMNGFPEEQVVFLTADLLEWLPEQAALGKQYDVVILDPPAFAKTRANVKNAVKGYRAVNRNGMKLVKNGGFLCTCSCSHFMTRELFETMLQQAAAEAHVRLRQVEARAQSPDHPILWSAAETYYLKFYIFQVVQNF